MLKNKAKVLIAFLLSAGIVLSGTDGMALRAEASGKKATIKLNKSHVSVKKGKKVRLKIVKKNVKKIVSVKWSAKNIKIATVSNKGIVTGKKSGKSTVITCKVKYQAKGSNKTRSKMLKCKVTVKKNSSKPAKTSRPAQTDKPAPTDQPAPSASLESLVPKTLNKKSIDQNPYMGSLDGSIHNDHYSSDVVDSVVSLGIYPEVAYGDEPTSVNATPNAFYDDMGRAVAAYRGGIAIKELSRDTVELLGSFIPSEHDSESYSIQTSYSFIDSYGNIVCPTSHGYIDILKTTDEKGNELKVFKKIMEVNVVSEAVKALGDDIDKNLLSITYDYDGNLWFVTGGFRKNPENSNDGFVGYLSKEYIEAARKGESLNAADYLKFMRLTQGENAENGISSCRNGVVILTNKSCYLFSAEPEINVKWKVDYESEWKAPLEGSGVTGMGLAWGSGTTPTLTNDLVLFTDNCTPINLYAISTNTGEVVAKHPVLDSLTGKEQVSVENSIIVYADHDKTSVIVCNWFGAGNPGLNSPDADSSIQTFENTYDPNWIREGNKYISPGVERIDIDKSGSSYSSKTVWTREDIRDTSILKLSTATGYLYGFWQNLETGYWGYNILDFDTGETALEVPVSKDNAYNNMGTGLMVDISGNAVYCPTNKKVLLRLQDRFVYMPQHKDVKINLDETGRKNIKDSFNKYSSDKCTPVSFLNTASFDALDETNMIAFRVNGIDSESANNLKLYAMDKSGKLKTVDHDKWQLTKEGGAEIKDGEEIDAESLYEIRFTVSDGETFDLSDKSEKIKVSVVLCNI